MTLHRHAIAAAVLIATSLGNAQADTVTYSSDTLPVQRTDWSSFAELQQFDPTLGLLQQVTLTLSGSLAGTARAESRNNAPSAITLNLQATLTLARPDNLNAVLVQTTPLASHVFQAAIYDNTTDYAGTSGMKLDNLSAATSSTASFTDFATLALFTGSGSLLLPVSAVGQSYAAGSGNLRAGFTTLAGGQASVTYLYEQYPQWTPPVGELPPVPEPTTWALMLAGLGVLGWLAKRRAA